MTIASILNFDPREVMSLFGRNGGTVDGTYHTGNGDSGTFAVVTTAGTAGTIDRQATWTDAQGKSGMADTVFSKGTLPNSVDSVTNGTLVDGTKFELSRSLVENANGSYAMTANLTANGKSYSTTDTITKALDGYSLTGVYTGSDGTAGQIAGHLSFGDHQFAFTDAITTSAGKTFTAMVAGTYARVSPGLV